MEQDQKRPTERGKTTVTRERPRTPASRPKDPRTRSGSASQREAARKARAAQTEPDRDSRQSAAQAPRSRQAAPEPSRRRSRQAEPERARRTELESRPIRSVAQTPPAERRAQTREAAPGKAAEAPAPSAKRGRKKKPHRVYNTNFAFKFGIMLAVVAVIVLSMFIFFKVKHIEVILPEGENGPASYYSAEDIINASGIKLDDNLLSLSKATVASRIQTALPYVNEIQIKKQLPGTVLISFTEFEVTYGIQDETGGWWLMNNEGRIMEAATEQSVRGHTVVMGMLIKTPEVGAFFKPTAAEGADLSEIASKEAVVRDVLPKLEKQSYAQQIVTVDVSTSYDLILWYGTRYEIRLGTTENLDYKLQYLQGVLTNLGKNNSGTIDLSFTENQNARFLPFK